jgi:hypothetical protein
VLKSVTNRKGGLQRPDPPGHQADRQARPKAVAWRAGVFRSLIANATTRALEAREWHNDHGRPEKLPYCNSISCAVLDNPTLQYAAVGAGSSHIIAMVLRYVIGQAMSVA